MQTKIKIGILGCGRIAQHYGYFFRRNLIKNVKIEFCCDLNLEKSKRLANVLKTDYGNSYSKLIIKHSINLIIILTESGKHYEHAKYFLKKNINVLVEKPATFNFNQSKSLHSIAKKNKLICCVGFQNRFNPSIKILKKMLEAELLGKLISVTVKINWCRYQEYYNDKWHGTWSMDGGVTNQQAIHHIDILTYLFGPAKEAISFMRKSLNQLEAEDTSVALIKFKSGLLSTFEATTAARPIDYEASLTVLGEKGRIKIGGIALNKIEEWNFNKITKYNSIVKNKFSQKVNNGYGKSHKELLNNLIAKLNDRKSKKEIVDIKSTFTTTNLISGLYQSSENGKVVIINNKSKSKKLGKK